MDVNTTQTAALVAGLKQLGRSGLDRLQIYLQEEKPLLLTGSYIKDFDGKRYCCPMVASLPAEVIAGIDCSIDEDHAVDTLREIYGVEFVTSPDVEYVTDGYVTTMSFEDALDVLEDMPTERARLELLEIIKKARAA